MASGLLLSPLGFMDSILRKYLWVLDLLVVAICAVFGARATASSIETRFFLGAGVPRPSLRATAPPVTVVHNKDPQIIIDRNIFCSTCAPVAEVVPDGGVSQEGGEAQKSTLPLQVLAIMYAPPPNDPRWSHAVIRDNDSKTSGPFFTGGIVRDGVTVQDIQESRVYISNQGRPEYLDLFEAEPAKPGASKAPTIAAAPPASGGDGLSDKLRSGIKKVGDTKFEVQRTALDAVLGNLSELSRSARIVPEIKDGRPAGFRLFSVRPDGPYALIGLQNGDVISAINGIEMTSPDQALGAYTKLKSASHLTVNLERAGKKTTMEYNIR